ncbi:MAG TPA: M28 family peptidase [Bryobacteraceae bacterium]|nr:M28 family peptidase [Bryobacteraceae bacterium]
MIRRTLLAGTLAGALLWAAELPKPHAIDADHYLGYVKYLASEKMRGRGTGSKELEAAAEYISKEFKAAGLQPVGGSYFQRFPVTTHAKLGGGNKLTLTVNGKKEHLEFEKDFIPLNFSAAGETTGEVVFVGYGITAPEYNYDDYAGIDVQDKIVVFFRREPQETDDKSPFAGRVYTRHAQFDSKATNAKLHGAKAAIVLTDILGSGSGDLEKFATNAGPANAGIPLLMMKAEAAEPLLEAAGRNLREIYRDIDKDLKPRSAALPSSVQVTVHADVQRVVKTVRNVVGYLPGETEDHVIVGAHYDHLGMGEQFSMAPSMIGKPHLGADDNASGSAGVLELARWMAQQPKPKRGVLFMTFAGEELGLLGSSYYVNNPLLPIDKAVAMINMDMIGRIKDGRVYVGGSGTGANFGDLLKSLPSPDGLQFDMSETAGYGSSDHTSFTTKQVPVLFFFSGLHGDYHKPSDTWEKINSKSAAALLGYIGGALQHLATDLPRPQYVRVLPPQSSHGSGSGSGSGGGSGYGPQFGSIPDFAEPPTGVRFADVREGTPAAKAGLKAGDILVRFDGKKVQNLMDFTVLLRQKKAGDEVEVEVLRDGQTVTAKVLLTARK